MPISNSVLRRGRPVLPRTGLRRKANDPVCLDALSEGCTAKRASGVFQLTRLNSSAAQKKGERPVGVPAARGYGADVSAEIRGCYGSIRRPRRLPLLGLMPETP
jgi:hypothetical protein